MATVGGRMANLHPPLGQQAADESKCQRPGFGSVRRSQIEPHRVNDLPESDMILMALRGKTLQHIIGCHQRLLSIDEVTARMSWVSRLPHSRVGDRLARNQAADAFQDDLSKSVCTAEATANVQDFHSGKTYRRIVIGGDTVGQVLRSN